MREVLALCGLGSEGVVDEQLHRLARADAADARDLRDERGGDGGVTDLCNDVAPERAILTTRFRGVLASRREDDERDRKALHVPDLGRTKSTAACVVTTPTMSQ